MEHVDDFVLRHSKQRLELVSNVRLLLLRQHARVKVVGKALVVEVESLHNSCSAASGPMSAARRPVLARAAQSCTHTPSSAATASTPVSHLLLGGLLQSYTWCTFGPKSPHCQHQGCRHDVQLMYMQPPFFSVGKPQLGHGFTFVSLIFLGRCLPRFAAQSSHCRASERQSRWEAHTHAYVDRR